MEIKTTKDGLKIAYMDEFELHDLLCAAQQALLNKGSDAIGGGIDEIQIVPKEQDFTQDLVHKWNKRMTKLFQLLGELDTDIHDDAEYTC